MIQRCLEKEAQDRFPSARESATRCKVAARVGVRALLPESPGSGARLVGSTNPAPSIAVLPFVNRSGDADNEFFSDGLSEDLINALSRLPGLQVASRTSAFRFRGSDLDIRQIGRQLEVATLSKAASGGPEAGCASQRNWSTSENGYQLWSERYDRQMADVFEIQDEIVASIVKAVVPALLGDATQAVERPTENTEAYELYLKGRHYWHQRSPSTLRMAIQCFEQAIKIDPQYALAYAGLADCYGILRVYGWVSAEEGRPQSACRDDKGHDARALVMGSELFARLVYRSTSSVDGGRPNRISKRPSQSILARLSRRHIIRSSRRYPDRPRKQSHIRSGLPIGSGFAVHPWRCRHHVQLPGAL